MFPESGYVWLPGWYHIIGYGIGIPFLAFRTWQRLMGQRQPLPNRLRHFRSTAITLTVLTGVSLWVARAEWIVLFPAPTLSWPGLAAGVAMYAGAVAFMRPRWRRAVDRRARVVHLFMPENPTERAWWFLVSLLAGVGEEITWRGVQTALLAALTGSYVVASILSAASFGIAHVIQGWRSILIITVFALAFQAIVWFSGSLYIAMTVHVLYDITAGLAYGRLGREMGYTPEVLNLVSGCVRRSAHQPSR